MSNELQNRERYKEVKKDDIEKVKTKVNKELATLRKENKLSVNEVKSLKQITPTTPKARPTLKAHKDPLKIRLIINTKGSAFYKIAKLVSKELKPLTTTGKSYIKDTEEFVSKLKNEKIEDDEKLISFDIADMYPSLPKLDVFNEVKRRINENEFKPAINKIALIKLAEISIQYMTFQIDGKFYEQAEGLFIGSPASPCFAELFIQRLEEVNIYKMIHTPRLWLRKVDDTFTISKYNMDPTLKELNQIHPNVKFTAEEEVNKSIPFLDCKITRTEEKMLKISVFKKKTHTGQYINFNSNQPLPVKLSTIKTLTKRAKTICTNQEDLNNELKYIQRTMELNDFPTKLVTKTIKKTLSSHNKNKKVREEDHSINLYLPYEKGLSEQISKMSKIYNVKVIHTKNKSLKDIMKEKDNSNISKMETQGVVYKIKCTTCEKSYIGETGRKLKIRVNEHKNDVRNNNNNISGLSQHAKETGHEIDWEGVEIIYKENNFNKRKFKEALVIKENSDKILNKKEEIRILSSIWEGII